MFCQRQTERLRHEGNLSFAVSVNFKAISTLFYVKLFDGGAESPSLTKRQISCLERQRDSTSLLQLNPGFSEERDQPCACQDEVFFVWVWIRQWKLSQIQNYIGKPGFEFAHGIQQMALWSIWKVSAPRKPLCRHSNPNQIKTNKIRESPGLKDRSLLDERRWERETGKSHVCFRGGSLNAL